MTRSNVPKEHKRIRRGKGGELPIIKVTDTLIFQRPTDKQWIEIQGDYCELSDADRKKLWGILYAYQKHASSELMHFPLKDGLKMLESIADAANSLRKLLETEVPPNKKHVIEWALNEASGMNQRLLPYSRFREIAMSVRMVELNCQNAIEKNKKKPPLATQTGLAWDGLVYEVLQWADAKGTPTTVAKKTENSINWPSKFVTFFRRLQDLLPEELKRGNTDSRLTDALLRAIAIVKKE